MPNQPADECSPPLTFSQTAPKRVDVAIVGGGFGGLIVLVHVLRRLPGVRVAVLERAPRRAPGIAYGAAGPSHLLNVPAERMGPFPDDPGAFFAWLDRREPGRHQAGGFVPRVLYGEFLLATVRAELEPFQSQVTFVRDSVERVNADRDGATVVLGSGRTIGSRAVVLALGLPAAAPPWATPGDRAVEGRVDDPWAPDALASVGADDRVMIVGTGLTALDMLVSLERRGHRGEVTFVSRGGRFPLPHDTERPGAPPVSIDVPAMARGARQALRALRTIAKERASAGFGWRAVLDAVRPHTSTIWCAWSDEERSRFVRRLRPFWEIHRHRAPREVWRLVQEGLGCGRISIARGTVERVVAVGPPAPHRLSVTVRALSGEPTLCAADWIVNCIGPAARVADADDPLVRSLLATGTATTDRESLGIHTDSEGRVGRSDGGANRRLFLLGALRRGGLWESTAVPELRVQAAAVGAALEQTLIDELPQAPGTPTDLQLLESVR